MIEGLNLHATVADALAELNPWQELTFTKEVGDVIADAERNDFDSCLKRENPTRGHAGSPATRIRRHVVPVLPDFYFRRHYAD